MAQESATKTRDGVPSWDGSAETFQTYCESALLYEQMTPYHKRYLVAPRLQNELQGAAKRLTIGQAPDWVCFEGGVQHLLDHLRRSLGRPQVPELTDLLSKYFKNSRRRPGELMGDYITRTCELYVRAQQAMLRLRPHHELRNTGGLHSKRAGDAWGGWGRRVSEDSGIASTLGGEPGEEVDAEAPATTPAAPTDGASEPAEDDRPTWSDWQWQGWWSQADAWSGYGSSGWQWSTPSHTASSNHAAARKPLPQLVPEFVQAWMLLQDAGLEYQERNTVIIANQGDMTLQRVAQELRNQFSDHDLLALRGWPSGFVCLVGGLGGRGGFGSWLAGGWKHFLKKGFLCVFGKKNNSFVPVFRVY